MPSEMSMLGSVRFCVESEKPCRNLSLKTSEKVVVVLFMGWVPPPLIYRLNSYRRHSVYLEMALRCAGMDDVMGSMYSGNLRLYLISRITWF